MKFCFLWLIFCPFYPVGAFLSHLGPAGRIRNLRSTGVGVSYEDSSFDGGSVDGIKEDNWLERWMPGVDKIHKPKFDYKDTIVRGTEGNNATFFKEYAQRGLKAFRETNDLQETLKFFDMAKDRNSEKRPQPFSQRGVVLYIANRFEEAELQLRQDIALIEEAKLFKASDLRLWRSACLYKLKRKEEAIDCLDVDNQDPSGLVEDKFIMIQLLNFYAGKKTLEEMVESIGSVEITDNKDLTKTSFYGNFYLGLYFDANGDEYFAPTFMSMCATSAKYPASDMWYHLPRVFMKERGWNMENVDEEVGYK